MKKSIILVIMLLLCITGTAQKYKEYRQQGEYYFNKKIYFTALEYFDLAYEFAKNETQKDETRYWKNKSKEKIKKQQDKLQEAIKKSRRILKALLPNGVNNIYKYFKTRADKNFSLGDYKAALKNYQLASDAPDKPKKSTVINNIETTEKCFKWQKNALDLMKSEKFKQAEKEILKVLEINPYSRNDIVIASAINPLREMIRVKGNSFIMGSKEADEEQPVHEVRLKSFKIARYEVSNLQFAVFLNSYGSDKVLSGKYTDEVMIYEHTWSIWKNPLTNKWEVQKGYEYHPILYVTWYGANAFCEYYGLSLPTEAQWEFAASGGIKSLKTEYSGNDSINKVAWQLENSKNTSTFQVGLLEKNELGIYDMSGNVWEWCQDSWHKDYINAPEDGSALIDEKVARQVFRGGSWRSGAFNCRVKHRIGGAPSDVYIDLGFRPVLVQ